METFLARVKQKFSPLAGYWSKLSLNQKVLFGGAALLVCIIIAALITTTNKQDYEILYTDLDSKSAAQVVEKLDEYKVAYKLADNGTTILVPPEVKNTTRIKLAGDNLPQGDSGFELFQQSSFGETQTDKKVKYQMALQGELARTIQSLDKIKAAKVNLVLPEDTLFVQNQEVPKASVIINTHDNVTLSPKEVQSIINLVANSVKSLNKDDVVIVDQNGTLLSEILPNDNLNLAEHLRIQQTMKREFEKQKQETIQIMLDKALGKDNSVVVVSAEMNFDDKEERAELYYHDEGGPHTRSESVERESSEQTTSTPTGIPGTDTNIPQYAQTQAGTTTGTTDRSSRISNYEISKRESMTKYAPGEVLYDYLTVTVLVNDRGTRNANIGTTEQEKINKVRALVASAVGLRENRPNENVRLDDNISVAFIDFVQEAEPEPASSTVIKEILARPYIPIAIILLVILIILLLWRVRRKSAEELEIEELIGETDDIFDAIVEDDLTMEDILEKVLTPEEKEIQRIKEEIDKLIESDPENAANVIKTWILEDAK